MVFLEAKLSQTSIKRKFNTTDVETLSNFF